MDPGSVPRVGDYVERGATFEYTDPRHAAWAGVADVWLQGTFENGFADDYLPVESIDPVTKRMNMGIYCDDSSTGVLVHGNDFCRMMT